MILVDTPVWVDHRRHGDPILRQRLQDDEILIHPFVLGGLALGGMRQSSPAMGLLMTPREATVASIEEVLAFTERHGLDGRGIGYVDVHLLVAARLTPGASLWTRDRRLGAVAVEMGLSADVGHRH